MNTSELTLDSTSVEKIKLMDDDVASKPKEAVLPIDIPVRDLLSLVSAGNHYEAMEVLAQRDYSSIEVPSKRQARFRFLIFKGRKQFQGHIYPRYDGFSCVNSTDLLVRTFYVKVFKAEEVNLKEACNDKHMWHIVLIGYRPPTEKENRDHDTFLLNRRKQNKKKKEQNKKFFEDDDPTFFPKKPSLWHVIAACTFKLLTDDNATIYVPFLAVTDEKASLKEWQFFAKNSKPKGDQLKSLQLLYDEKSFNGGKGIGKTMIAVLQYISSLIAQARVPDETKRDSLRILCESNLDALKFYKVGVGMIEFDVDQEGSVPQSLKEKVYFTWSLTPLKLYDAVFDLRPPNIKSSFFDMERLLKKALVFIYRLERRTPTNEIFNQLPRNVQTALQSFFYQPADELVTRLCSNRQTDLQHLVESSLLKNHQIPKNSPLTTVASSLVLQSFFGDLEAGEIQLCPMTSEGLGFCLLRCLVYDMIQALPEAVRAYFHNEAHTNMNDWFFDKTDNRSLDQERQFFIYVCWHIAKMDAQVGSDEDIKASKYYLATNHGDKSELHQYTWLENVSEKRELTQFERTYMNGALIESILNLKKVVRARMYKKLCSPHQLQDMFHEFAETLADCYYYTKDGVIDPAKIRTAIAERHGIQLILLSLIFKIRFIVVELHQGKDQNIFFIKREFICAVDSLQVLRTIVLNKSPVPAENENRIEAFEWSVLSFVQKEEFASMVKMETLFANHCFFRREEIKAGHMEEEQPGALDRINKEIPESLQQLQIEGRDLNSVSNDQAEISNDRKLSLSGIESTASKLKEILPQKAKQQGQKEQEVFNPASNDQQEVSDEDAASDFSSSLDKETAAILESLVKRQNINIALD
jgi:hypothetical protein